MTASKTDEPPPNASNPSISSYKALPTSRYLSAALAGIVFFCIGARLILIFTTHATEEDFYITLRYAENFARGVGLVYNPGEPVLGTTTPLYTLLLALIVRLHLDPVLGGKLIAVAADALSCWFLFRLGRAMGRPVAGLYAAVFLALAPTNLTEAVKGMEVSLVACACVGAWAFWAERREGPAWICAAILLLLRIDGAALALLLFFACLWRDRRIPWRGLALFAALLAPWLLYATTVFGSPIPTSLRAKLIVYSWHSHALFPNVLPFLRLMTRNPLSAFLFASALLYGGYCLIRFLRSADRTPFLKSSDALLLFPFCWILLYYGGMAFSKVFLFGWYFVPPTPIYYLAAMTGWSLAAAWIWKRMQGKPQSAEDADVCSEGDGDTRRRSQGPGKMPLLNSTMGVTGVLIAAILLTATVVPRTLKVMRESQREEERLRIPIGLWLKAHGRPQETVMLEPIGYIGYFSGLRVLDTVGLVSPEALRFYRASEPSPYHALWQRFQPEWILLRAGEWTDLQRYEQSLPAPERLQSHYTIAQTWRSPDAAMHSLPAFTLFHRNSAPYSQKRDKRADSERS